MEVFFESGLLGFGEILMFSARGAAETAALEVHDGYLYRMSKGVILDLVHKQIKDLTPFFALGSVCFGLGVYLLAEEFSVNVKDSQQEQQHSKVAVVLGVAACVARLYFALRAPKEVLTPPYSHAFKYF